jgi:hypothetical protein
MIRSGEGQNPPVAEGSGQDTPGPKSLESSRGGRSRSRSGSSSGKRDRDRGRDRSRSRTPGSGRSRRARGQLKTEADQRISVDRSARETPSPRRVGGAGPAPPPSTGCGSGGARPPRGPSRYGRLDESSTGSAEGGRMRNGEGAARRPQRQAGRIDYWIEPNSSVAPDRPRRAAAARRRWPSAHHRPAVPSSRPIVVDTRLHPEGEPSSSSDAIRRVVLQGRCRGRPTWLPRQVRLRGAAWAMWTGAP